MSDAIPTLSVYAFMVCTRTTLFIIICYFLSLLCWVCGQSAGWAVLIQ